MAQFMGAVWGASKVLPGRRHQRGIDDLPAPGDEALLEQLRRHPIEQRLGTRVNG